MNDALIFGKSGYKNIVSIEVDEESGYTEIFQQDDTGMVSSTHVPNKYWILSNEKLNNRFVRLGGELHYKWGIQFSDRKEFLKFRQIWKNKDIYSIYNAKEATMVKDGYTYYRDLHPKDVSVLSFDIETTGLDPRASDAKILLISTTFRRKDFTEKKLFAYDEYETEHDLVEAFCMYVRKADPSIICGHNILQYDFMYLEGRVGNLYLGRDGSALKYNKYKNKFRVDGNRDLEFNNAHIYGREICDTYFLAQKFDVSKSFESYGLKKIIEQLGMTNSDRTFYEASEIRYNYKDPIEWEKIKEYCKDDSDDSLKLWDHMGSAYFFWAQKVPKAFQEILLTATGSQINSIMVRSYLQNKHSIPKASPTKKFEGAISYGKSGIYNNCVRWDISSLYPSIIIAFDVYSEDKDPQGNFLKLVKILTKQRLEHKKLAKETGSKYYNDLQESEKIGINSAYGFMGAPGLNFNCSEAAEFITAKGREILEKAITWATSKSFKEVAPDYFEIESDEESA